jgi:glycosyltransferase involved in cell wall biosynthesis
MLLQRSLSHHRMRKRLFLATIGRRILAGAAVLHFATQAELDHAAAVLPAGPERVVVPLTVESNLMTEQTDKNQWRQYFSVLPDSWPRLLFLSRLHPVKNLPALIAAIPLLAVRFPGLHLVIAGTGDPGYVCRMKRLAEQAGVGKRTYFLGAVAGEAKLALLRSATVTTIPSLHESFGMALAESLACGVPVLVTPEMGLRQEILANGAGFASGESASSIAESLAKILCDPIGITAAGENGRRWANSNLSPSVVSRKFMEIYASAVIG